MPVESLSLLIIFVGIFAMAYNSCNSKPDEEDIPAGNEDIHYNTEEK